MNKKKLCFVILLLIAFIINTILVVKGYYTNIDDSIHNYILLIKNDYVDKIMRIITFFGSTKFMVALCLILFISFLIKINI